jgi:hypothetical protein
MGLLNDLYNLGKISSQECKEIAEEWADNEETDYVGLGSRARNTGDTEAFQTMTEEMALLGSPELANEAFAMYQDSINNYVAEYGGLINYNSTSERWYNVENGQFVGDPYTWQRD